MRVWQMKTSGARDRREAASGKLDRRQFLTVACLAGGCLVLKSSVRLTDVLASDGAEAAKLIPLNAWLKIGSDDSVTIVVSQAEMGQGIRTTLPAVLAEEL